MGEGVCCVQSGSSGAEGRACTDHERASGVPSEALHQGPGAAAALTADLQTLAGPECSVSTHTSLPPSQDIGLA